MCAGINAGQKISQIKGTSFATIWATNFKIICSNCRSVVWSISVWIYSNKWQWICSCVRGLSEKGRWKCNYSLQHWPQSSYGTREQGGWGASIDKRIFSATGIYVVYGCEIWVSVHYIGIQNAYVVKEFTCAIDDIAHSPVRYLVT